MEKITVKELHRIVTNSKVKNIGELQEEISAYEYSDGTFASATVESSLCISTALTKERLTRLSEYLPEGAYGIRVLCNSEFEEDRYVIFSYMNYRDMTPSEVEKIRKKADTLLAQEKEQLKRLLKKYWNISPPKIEELLNIKQ